MTQMLDCDWPEDDPGVNVNEWQLNDTPSQSSTMRKLRRASLSQV